MHIFDSQIKKIKLEKLNFTEKLWYYKAHVWKNQLLQDYKYTLKYAYHWVELFHQKTRNDAQSSCLVHQKLQLFVENSFCTDKLIDWKKVSITSKDGKF